MKKVLCALLCIGFLLFCGCGERGTAAVSLPGVRFLDGPEASAAAEDARAAAVSAAFPADRTIPVDAPEDHTAEPSPVPTEAPEPTPDPAVCPYVGSRNSTVYHLAGCSQAARIKAENLLGWLTAEAAQAAGRTPCKVCLSGKPEKTPKPTAPPAPVPTPEETVTPLATPAPTETQQPAERGRIGESASAFVGSRNSDVYHRSDCPQAGRIKPENLIGWLTAAEAEAAGKRACTVCLGASAAEAESVPPTAPEPTPEMPPEERSSPAAYAYVGSRNSDKYHLPTCRHAGKIAEENLVGWASREEAEAAGYSPCKTCSP